MSLLLCHHSFSAVFASSLCCIGPAEEKIGLKGVSLRYSKTEMRMNQKHSHIQCSLPSFAVWSRICCSEQCYSCLLQWCLSDDDLDHIMGKAKHVKRRAEITEIPEALQKILELQPSVTFRCQCIVLQSVYQFWSLWACSIHLVH